MSYTVYEFIAKVAPIITKEAKQRGYAFPSAIIAQAILESRSGNSALAKYNNFFGLKCGSSYKGRSVNLMTKEEYRPGEITNIRDNFRAYATVEEGIKGYFDFINTRRYANLRAATSSKDYLNKIKADGYATATAYAENTYSVVIKYNLTQFDSAVETAIFAPMPTMRRGSKGADIALLQKCLNKLFSAGLAVDGSYGPATTRAVKVFQASAGLSADGIYGPKSYAKLKELLDV